MLLVSVAVSLGFLAPPPARASYDPLGSGTTTLRFAKSFRVLLQKHGVEVATREGAKFKPGTLRFPVSGGRFDPASEKGTVEHGGAVLFEGGGHPVSLKGLQLKTTRRSSPLVAKLGGGQLKLGSPQRLTIARSGFGNEVVVSSIRLTAKFATRLSKRLRLRGVFKEGMLFGSAVTRVNPATVTVLGQGAVQLDVDAGMAAKLDDLHVAFNPIFPAERRGSFTLPIFGGELSPDFSSGFLQLQGGLELLQLGGGQVVWRESVLDLSGQALSPEVEVKPSPPYAGKVGQQAVAALNLGAGAPSASSESRTLAVNGAALTLSAATAALFNEVFAKPQDRENVFAPGETFGRISFLAQAQ
jgi:hypothetical protein